MLRVLCVVCCVLCVVSLHFNACKVTTVGARCAASSTCMLGPIPTQHAHGPSPCSRSRMSSGHCCTVRAHSVVALFMRSQAGGHISRRLLHSGLGNDSLFRTALLSVSGKSSWLSKSHCVVKSAFCASDLSPCVSHCASASTVPTPTSHCTATSTVTITSAPRCVPASALPMETRWKERKSLGTALPCCPFNTEQACTSRSMIRASGRARRILR